MRQTSSLAALVLSTPLARRVERSGAGGGANEKKHADWRAFRWGHSTKMQLIKK